MWCDCNRNPLDANQRQQMVAQIISLRAQLGLTPAQLGSLLTQLEQGERDVKRKYWIGLKYYPAYIKRWEAGNPPSWNTLVTLKQLADAYDIPFQLPTAAAPRRLQGGLPKGDYYYPGPKTSIADIPDPLPPLESGRAFAPSKRIRRFRPRTNPGLMNSLTDYSYTKNPNPEEMTWEQWYNAATAYARRAPSAAEILEMQADWRAGVDPTEWVMLLKKLSGRALRRYNPLRPEIAAKLSEWCADKEMTQRQMSARLKEEFGVEYGQGYISRLCLELGFRRKHDVPAGLMDRLREWCADKQLTQKQIAALIEEKFGIKYSQSNKMLLTFYANMLN